MNGNLAILIVISALTVVSMLAASLKKSWAKATTILLTIATLWFGFQWNSWAGAIGTYVAVFLLTFILSRTLFKSAVAKANGWDKHAK